MQPDEKTNSKLLPGDFTDAVIRIGLIAVLVFACYRIFAPFTGLMLWAMILAVAVYPLHKRLADRLRQRQGLTAILIVLAFMLAIGIPAFMVGSSFATSAHKAYVAFDNHSITVPPPRPAIKDWPIVGKQIYGAWGAASDNLSEFLDKNREQLGALSKKVLSIAANMVGNLMKFLGSVIIAGIMMAYGEGGNRSLGQIFRRFAGEEKGPRLQQLSTATIRSVATGVIGVAFIQALLMGIGFIIAGIPAAGVLALIAMVIGIMQLPGLIITLPAIAYIWWAGGNSTALNIFCTIYLVLASMADNVLKPLLLGRGVEVPMPVILLGALGGMVSAGIIGLFLGATLLAIGYQVFMGWVGKVDEDPSAKPSPG